MAITPTCDKCGQELSDFGGILLSPPDEHDMVHKYHLCVQYFTQIEETLGK